MDLQITNKLTFSFKALNLLLRISVVLSVLAIAVGFFENHSLVALDSKLGLEEIDEKMLLSNLIVGLTGLVEFIVALITFIFGGRFLYFAHKNLRENLKAENLEFTPGWAIGWYCVPVMNAWKPFMVMRELWRASKTQKGWWTNPYTSKLLPWWWGFWVISLIIDRVSMKLSFKAKYVDELITSNLVTLSSDALEIPLTILFLLIVNKIYAMQMESLKRVEAAEKRIDDGF